MELARQRVYLDGGSFDGTTAMAFPPPATLTVPLLMANESTCLETYAYMAGLTKSTARDGVMAVMGFDRRSNEGTALSTVR